MADHDAGQTQRVVHTPDQAHDDAHRDRIETDKRLVIEDQVRIHRDGARQRDASGHAAGQLRRHQFRGTAQPHCVQLGEDDVPDQTFRQARMLAQREGDILVDTDVGQQRAVLEQHADTLARVVEFAATHAADVTALDQDAAVVRQDLARDQTQQGGLAGTAGAHDGGHATARYIQIETVEDLAMTAGIVQVANDRDVLVPTALAAADFFPLLLLLPHCLRTPPLIETASGAQTNGPQPQFPHACGGGKVGILAQDPRIQAPATIRNGAGVFPRTPNRTKMVLILRESKRHAANEQADRLRDAGSGRTCQGRWRDVELRGRGRPDRADWRPR